MGAGPWNPCPTSPARLPGPCSQGTRTTLGSQLHCPFQGCLPGRQAPPSARPEGARRSGLWDASSPRGSVLGPEAGSPPLWGLLEPCLDGQTPPVGLEVGGREAEGEGGEEGVSSWSSKAGGLALCPHPSPTAGAFQAWGRGGEAQPGSIRETPFGLSCALPHFWS